MRFEPKKETRIRKNSNIKPPSYSPEQLKRMRGIRLAESGAIEFIDVGKWRCKGHDEPYYYITQIGKDLFECTCPDYKFRGFTSEITDNMLERQPLPTEFFPCKHIIGVKFLIDQGANKLI